MPRQLAASLKFAEDVETSLSGTVWGGSGFTLGKVSHRFNSAVHLNLWMVFFRLKKVPSHFPCPYYDSGRNRNHSA